jgi:hypothetical protein
MAVCTTLALERNNDEPRLFGVWIPAGPRINVALTILPMAESGEALTTGETSDAAVLADTVRCFQANLNAQVSARRRLFAERNGCSA